jgi:hypothetical protein
MVLQFPPVPQVRVRSLDTNLGNFHGIKLSAFSAELLCVLCVLRFLLRGFAVKSSFPRSREKPSLCNRCRRSKQRSHAMPGLLSASSASARLGKMGNKFAMRVISSSLMMRGFTPVSTVRCPDLCRDT